MIGVLLSLALAAEPSAPAVAAGQRWSVVGALTAGTGGNVVEGGLGCVIRTLDVQRWAEGGDDEIARAVLQMQAVAGEAGDLVGFHGFRLPQPSS